MHRNVSLSRALTLLILLASGGLLIYLYSTISYKTHGGVRIFGQLALGKDIPIGTGATTFAPKMQVPPSRFYVNIVQKDLWCTFEDCHPDGAIVNYFGGWLQGANIDQPETKEMFGLEQHREVTSLIVIGNQYGKIVGIYPNKGIWDLFSVLDAHKDLLVSGRYARTSAVSLSTLVDDWRREWGKDPYGEVLIGGTLALFLDALYNNDTDLAAKYFVFDQQEQWTRDLAAYKKSGAVIKLIDTFVYRDGVYEPAKEVYPDQYFLSVAHGATEKRFPINLITNKATNKWKINARPPEEKGGGAL